MIWLTWRQFRAQAAVLYAALAALGVLLLVTGLRLHSGSGAVLDRFSGGGTYQAVYLLGLAAVLAAPAVIGVFWGAPLITRELDSGTHRLVWNQSVTRTGWLASKLAVVGLAAVTATGALSLMTTWWSAPITRAATGGHVPSSSGLPGFASERFSPVSFAAHGVVPIGYAAFAFTLGVTVGAVVRRTLPAIAATLALFVAVQVAVPFWIRPHLITPARLTTEITTANLRGFMASGPGAPAHVTVSIGKPGAWIISNQTLDPAGRVIDALPAWATNCAPPPGQPGTTAQRECFAKLSDLGYRQLVTYQPADHYWALQWAETATFLTAALALTGLCFWRIRRLT
ncbi:ABC transporter permease [Actinoallomurus sp. CA-150999]|uniref:ABC transporter permease n=1 Tax=Actinoallomurus sp. CA-150999 TaxID=3239887 RepID=UPI003D926FFB